MIQSTDRYIISYQKEFRIYKKSTLSILKTLSESNVKLFQIFKENLLFSTDSGVFLYNIQNSSKIEISNSFKVDSIFIKDSFIYIGGENGTVNVYNYNEHIAKLNKSYKHPGPVKSIVSDNIKVYVADIRNKVTVYPDNISYDFMDPTVLFKNQVYTLSQNKLYAHTQDTTGFVLEFSCPTEKIQFGPTGGTIFGYSNGFVCVYDTLGNQLGKFMANDYTVIENNGKCQIVQEINDKLEIEETYIRDLEVPEFNFPKVEIQKKVLNTEEYEKKYVYVDDGNKKSLKKSSKKIKKNLIQNSYSEDYEESENINNRKKETFVYDSEDSNGNYTVISNNDQNIDLKSPFLNPVLVTKNPSSYENTEGRLLFYSSQGFMISLESALSNQIFIKYHDRSFESYEIKDTLKCKLGSFLNSNYVISDGKTVNFSGLWTKEINCSLLGLNSTHIYAFDKSNLTVLDYQGKIADTYYIKDAYSFCAGEKKLAIFCQDFIMIMTENNTDYIPCTGIEFGCYDNDELFVKIGNRLFTLVNRCLKALCELTDRPLTVYDNNVVVLSENTILPRPAVKFIPIKPETIEQIDFESYGVGRYDPTKRY